MIWSLCTWCTRSQGPLWRAALEGGPLPWVLSSLFGGSGDHPTRPLLIVQQTWLCLVPSTSSSSIYFCDTSAGPRLQIAHCIWKVLLLSIWTRQFNRRLLTQQALSGTGVGEILYQSCGIRWYDDHSGRTQLAIYAVLQVTRPRKSRKFEH